MRNIFLGKTSHWLMWVFIIGVMIVMNKFHLHVVYFKTFSLLMVGLGALCVGIILMGYRPGDAITREPFDEAR